MSARMGHARREWLLVFKRLGFSMGSGHDLIFLFEENDLMFGASTKSSRLVPIRPLSV